MICLTTRSVVIVLFSELLENMHHEKIYLASDLQQQWPHCDGTTVILYDESPWFTIITAI